MQFNLWTDSLTDLSTNLLISYNNFWLPNVFPLSDAHS